MSDTSVLCTCGHTQALHDGLARGCMVSGSCNCEHFVNMVNHPPHYTSHPSGVECITITRWMNFNIGNATKYLWRAGLKGDALEDLKKARWYVDDEIARLEKAKP